MIQLKVQSRGVWLQACSGEMNDLLCLSLSAEKRLMQEVVAQMFDFFLKNRSFVSKVLISRQLLESQCLHF